MPSASGSLRGKRRAGYSIADLALAGAPYRGGDSLGFTLTGVAANARWFRSEEQTDLGSRAHGSLRVGCIWRLDAACRHYAGNLLRGYSLLLPKAAMK
jgi:hypothetical protein